MARNPLTQNRVVGVVEHEIAAPFHSLHRQMNQLFEDIFRGRLHGAHPASAAQGGPLMPHIDVSETDGEVRIHAELPGVSEKDVDVSLDGDVLIIRGVKKFEQTDDKENYHLVERAYGTFQRALRLPWPINADKIAANFGNGVLTVMLPKSVEPQTSRKIPIQQGDASASASAGQSAAPQSSPEGAPAEAKGGDRPAAKPTSAGAPLS